MNLEEYAVMIIKKAEKAVEEDKDVNEAIRLLTLLQDVILDQCRKLAEGK